MLLYLDRKNSEAIADFNFLEQYSKRMIVRLSVLWYKYYLSNIREQTEYPGVIILSNSSISAENNSELIH